MGAQKLPRVLIDVNTALSLYKTIITPVFDHADIVFDCLSAQDTDRLQHILIILQADSRIHIRDMHKDLELNYLVDRRHLNTPHRV